MRRRMALYDDAQIDCDISRLLSVKSTLLAKKCRGIVGSKHEIVPKVQ